MKAKKLSQGDEGVAMLISLLKMEDESGEDEPWEDETIPTGTYAKDSRGRIWKLDESVTALFQGLEQKK